MGIEYVLKSVGALIFIIFAANVLLKKMNEYVSKGNKRMRILEKLPLSRTSSLYIVEVLGKYYLMSGTEQHNEILRELSASEMADFEVEVSKEKGLSQ